MIERMLNDSESAELRMLQAKAYGRDGALSAVERDRLQELEAGRGRLRPAELARGLDSTEDLRVVERAEGETKEGERAERVEAVSPTQHPWRRHPLVFLVGAATAAVIVGVGIGWLAFGRDAVPAIAVTAEQQVRGEQLAEEAKLDSGTIMPMAEDADVLVWTGTRDEGEITCMIIDDGEHDTTSCGPTESVTGGGLHATLSRDAPASSGNDTEMISASMGLAREDEPVVMLQRGWISSSNDGYLDMFTDPEQRATAARLLDEGFDEWSPMLAAYDGDTPIWIGIRDNAQEMCLFYGGEWDAPSACGAQEEAQSEGVNLTVLDFSGETPTGVSVTLRYTEQMMPSIVITPVTDTSELVTDSESGDPIEFTPVGPSVDDKTGD